MAHATEVPRRIAGNALSLTASEVASQVLSYGLGLITVRILGPAVYGQYAVLLALAGLFTPLGQLASARIVVREVARDSAGARAVVANAFAVRSFAALLVGGFMVLTVWRLGYPSWLVRVSVGIALVTAVNLLSALFRTAFQGIERMGYDSAAKILERLIAAGLGAALLLGGFGLAGIATALLLSSVAALLLSVLLAVHSFGPLQARAIRYDACVSLLRASAPLCVAEVLVSVYFTADTLILSRLAGELSVGLYGAAKNLVVALSSLSLALNTAVFPTLVARCANPSEFRETFQKIASYLWMIALPMGAGLAALAAYLVPLMYGDSYRGAAPLLSVMCGTLILRFVTSLCGSGLIASGNERTVATIASSNAVLSILLSILMVPRWGALGAALTGLLTELGCLLIYSCLFTTHFRLSPIPHGLWKIVLATLAMVGLVKVAVPQGIALAVLVGMITYVLLIILLRSVSADDLRLLRLILKLRDAA